MIKEKKNVVLSELDLDWYATPAYQKYGGRKGREHGGWCPTGVVIEELLYRASRDRLERLKKGAGRERIVLVELVAKEFIDMKRNDQLTDKGKVELDKVRSWIKSDGKMRPGGREEARDKFHREEPTA